MTESSKDCPSEHIEQREFVRWFRREFPGVLIFAIPNGGHRAPAVAAKMKAEGALAGVPDLFVPEWRLLIEMKRRNGGSVSKDQRLIMAELERVGYRCVVCAGADEAMEQAMISSRGVACTWEENDDGAWDTDCGRRFEFTDGGPSANHFLCCPYCSRQLFEITMDALIMHQPGA